MRELQFTQMDTRWCQRTSSGCCHFWPREPVTWTRPASWFRTPVPGPGQPLTAEWMVPGRAELGAAQAPGTDQEGEVGSPGGHCQGGHGCWRPQGSLFSWGPLGGPSLAFWPPPSQGSMQTRGARPGRHTGEFAPWHWDAWGPGRAPALTPGQAEGSSPPPRPRPPGPCSFELLTSDLSKGCPVPGLPSANLLGTNCLNRHPCVCVLWGWGVPSPGTGSGKRVGRRAKGPTFPGAFVGHEPQHSPFQHFPALSNPLSSPNPPPARFLSPQIGLFWTFRGSRTRPVEPVRSCLWCIRALAGVRVSFFYHPGTFHHVAVPHCSRVRLAHLPWAVVSLPSSPCLTLRASL